MPIPGVFILNQDGTKVTTVLLRGCIWICPLSAEQGILLHSRAGQCGMPNGTLVLIQGEKKNIALDRPVKFAANDNVTLHGAHTEYARVVISNQTHSSNGLIHSARVTMMALMGCILWNHMIMNFTRSNFRSHFTVCQQTKSVCLVL